MKENKKKLKIKSDAFPKEMNRFRPHSDVHIIFNDKEVNLDNIVYKQITKEEEITEVKLLHKEWFPIDYDDEYFEKIFKANHDKFITIGAFYVEKDENLKENDTTIDNFHKEMDETDTESSKEYLIGAIIADIQPYEQYGNKITIYKPYFFNFCPPCFLYINTIGVIDKFRRLGISTKLLNEATRMAKCRARIKGIYLHVVTYNDSAIRYYRKNGFTHDGTLRNYYKINGEIYDGDIYVKVFEQKTPYLNCCCLRKKKIF